jgi:hypothetical protein
MMGKLLGPELGWLRPSKKVRRLRASLVAAAFVLGSGDRTPAVGAPLASATAPSPSAALAPPPDTQWVVPEVVVVRRGPVFWRVRRGRSEVWVLAAPTNLASNDWDATAVKTILARARVVYTQPRLSIGLLGALGVVLGGQYREPGGRTLADVLTTADLARFEAVARAAKLNPNDWMHLRPAWIAVFLLPSAMAARRAVGPEARVDALARQAQVPVRPVATFSALSLLKQLEAISADQAAPCVNEAVNDVAFQSGQMDEATRAWGNGDLAALRSHYRPMKGSTACPGWAASTRPSA